MYKDDRKVERVQSNINKFKVFRWQLKMTNNELPPINKCTNLLIKYHQLLKIFKKYKGLMLFASVGKILSMSKHK